MGFTKSQILAVGYVYLRSLERRKYLEREQAREEYQERQARKADQDRQWKARKKGEDEEWEARVAAWENARANKERLIAEAIDIQGSTDWKATSERQRQLMADWRIAGNAGKRHSDDLWNRFNAARQVFFDAQKHHFEAVHKELAKASSAKAEIISKIRAFRDQERWIGGPQRIMELRTAFQKAGYAGRDANRQLSAELREAISTYLTARDAAMERPRDE